MTEMNYPPPPPPPPPTPAKSRKTIVVALLIVLVIASAIALAYMATGGFNSHPNNNATPSPSHSPSGLATASPSSSPSHTGTPTASATPTATPATTPQHSATPAPSGQGTTNFRAGAWANYTIKFLDNETGELLTETHMKESVDAGTYNGITCWLLTTAQDQTYGGYTTTSKTVLYMNKNTMQSIHVKYYTNDTLTYEADLNATSSTDPGTTSEIDPSTIVSYETITVPAGTFTNCYKATFASTTGPVYVWGHQDVPIFGLVKMELYSGTALVMSEELTAYGG